MSFLYAAFLTALAAAAIPLILHLLSRLRLPLIPFSSLEFLKRNQKRKARRIELRQLILLALRTLAVAAIVLAFTRPALKGSESTGSAAAVEMVIIIDDGMSSAAETRDGQTLRIAARRGLELIDLVGTGDRITLVPASKPRSFEAAAFGQVDHLRIMLNELTPKPWAPDISGALAVTDSLFAASEQFNRELYIISGFYGAAWDSLSLQRDGNFARTFIMPVGMPRLDNLAVESATIENTILQRGRPVEITGSIANYSSKAAKNVLLGVYLEGQRVAQASVDIHENGSVRHHFTVTPESTGRLGGWVKLEGFDALQTDNKRYFILDIPDSLRVMAVASDSLSKSVLRAVFSAEEAGFVSITWVSASEWETVSLAGYDALILAGVPAVSDGAAERARQFVMQGGGIVIFQSEDSDLSNLSRGIWHELGFAGASNVMRESTVSWGKFDLSHPLFHGMFEEDGSPRPPSHSFIVELAVGSGDQMIIPLSTGGPFLIERAVGKGRALMFAASLSPDGGDFVFSGIIAPLIFRSVSYTAAGTGEGAALWETGRNYRAVLKLPQAWAAELVMPDGARAVISPRPVLGGVEYEFAIATLPGIYELQITGRVEARFASNPPIGQSQLARPLSFRRKPESRLPSIWGNVTVIDGDADNPKDIIYAARFGRELWMPIAAAFLILLAAESVIGRTSRKGDEGQ